MTKTPCPPASIPVSQDRFTHARAGYDTIVVGGGLAGLTAAALLGRAGRRVAVLERATRLGGRARTDDHDGFCFNQGPHALYEAGAAHATLASLGVAIHGRRPASDDLRVASGEGIFALPVTPRTLLTTALLGWRDKVALAGFLGRVPKTDPRRFAGRPVADWLDEQVDRPAVRRLVVALLRLSTYAAAVDEAPAARVIRQFQLALSGGVRYLDGGWQTLVDGLAHVAAGHGVVIRTGVRVAAVEHGTRLAVVLDDGSRLPASSVVLAVDPARADALLGPGSVPALRRWASEASPLRAACLDLGLDRLPVADAPFLLGLECPLYASVHSATAALTPRGGALVHVARYLALAEKPGRDEVATELEAFLDRLQPGWRPHLRHRRLSVALPVAHGMPAPGAEVPTPAVPDVPGLWVAGDWVGDEGMLADAAVASARRAAEGILAGVVHRAA